MTSTTAVRPKAKARAAAPAVETRCIRTPKEWAAVVQEAYGKPKAFDTEYESHGYPRIIPVGFSLAWQTERGFTKVYVPLNHAVEGPVGQWTRLPTQLTVDQVRLGLQKLITDGQRCYMHNATADLKICHLMRIDTTGINLFDTMLASWILKVDSRHGLKPLTKEHFGHTMNELLTFAPVAMVEDRTKPVLKSGPRKGLYRLRKSKPKLLLITRIPIDTTVIDYASEDALYTLRLGFKFEPLIVEAKMEKVYHSLIMEVVLYLCEMEDVGMVIDRKYLRHMYRRLTRRGERFQQKAFRLAKREFNVKSTKDLNEVLFGQFVKHTTVQRDGKPVKKITAVFRPERSVFRIAPKGEVGKSGLYSTKADNLNQFAADGHRIAKVIVEHSKAKHLAAMIKGWLARATHHPDGTWRLHGSFNLHTVRTGRLSARDPNLQNIPTREKRFPIRQGFVAPPNAVFGDVDFSQIELRLLAHFSNDERMLSVMRAGGDLHSETAKIAYHLKPPAGLDLIAEGKWIKEHHDEKRGRSKNINFACLPDRARVLTPVGWKTRSEILVGDRVMGYNAKTDVMEWTKVTAVAAYPDAPVIRLSNRHICLESTPNHRWYGDRITGRGRTKRTVPSIFTTDQMTTSHAIHLSSFARVPGEQDVTPEEAALVAWLVTDGSIQYQRNTVTASVFQKKPRSLQELHDFMQHFPHTMHIRPTGVVQFRLSTPWFREFWERMQMNQRSLSEFVIGLSSEARVAFWEAALSAEGHVCHDRQQFCQNTGPVCDALQLTAFLQGHFPTVSTRRSYNGKLNNTVSLSKPYVTGQRLKRESLPSQAVWCPATELGTWVAELNGQYFITGNTVYGAGPNTISVKYGIPLAEAQQLLKRHPSIFPGAYAWMAWRRKRSHQTGTTTTLLGRVRHLPDIQINAKAWGRESREKWKKAMGLISAAERRAVNSPIQGSAADLIMVAMRNIRRHFIKTGEWLKTVFPVAQVHDELVFYFYEKAQEHLNTIMDLMRNAVRLRLPVEVAGKIAANWAAAK